MNTFRHKGCPLCGSDKIEKAGVISYETPTLFSNHEIKVDLKPEHWRCKSCKSSFVQNILPEKDARSLYTRGTGEKWTKPPFTEAMTGKVIKTLAGIFRPGLKVLDIGCNTGDLLDYAKSKGCETSGVEFSERGRNICEKKGHKTYASVGEVKEEFDVVTAFDLIEHLYSPALFIKTCRDMLVPKGLLIIITGDINSLSARCAKSNWWYLSYPEHVIFPSKKFLSSQYGFKIEGWIKTYAAAVFKHPLQMVCYNFLITFLEGRYTGLPSLGPDHVLIILRKCEGTGQSSVPVRM